MSFTFKSLLSALSALGAGGLLLFACSSTSNVTAAQACTDVATARCAKAQQCNPQGLLNTYGDLAACESAQSTTCVANLAAPDTANTPAHTEACALALPSQSCDDNALGLVPSDCAVPAGSRDAGSDCAVSAQCETAYCLTPKTASCGSCAETPGSGASCLNTPCGPGFLCDKVSSVCVSPIAASGACDDSSACAPGLTCIGNTASALGACVPVSGLGASCDITSGGSRCDGRLGLYCNTEAGKVCAQVATASAGGSCGTIDGGVTDCLADAFCQKSAGSTSGTCVAPAAEGAMCDTVNGPICTSPARCILSAEGGTTGICTTTNPQTCN